MRGQRFRLLRAGVIRRELELVASECEAKADKDREKLERVMLYGQSAACRWRLLHEYFGEPFERESCGHCDNCRQPLEEQLGLKPEEKPNGAGQTPAAKGDGAAKRKPPPELSAGDAVRLPKLGRGRVASVEDDKVTVKFPDGETRTFKREFVKKVRSGER